MRNPYGRRLLWLLTPLFLALTANVPHAATFYVAPGGNDASAGTSAQPWRTLQKAANTARAGDLVLVANGTYAGMQVTADGTAAAPITFRANGGNVLVNSQNASTPDNINIEGGNYVTVEGFIVEDAPRIGIRAVTATGIKILNNIVRRSGLTGILTGYTPSIEISGNSASGALDEHGIYVSNSTAPPTTRSYAATSASITTRTEFSSTAIATLAATASYPARCSRTMSYTTTTGKGSA